MASVTAKVVAEVFYIHMSKNNNIVGFMADVICRKNDGSEAYVLMPGQAFPAAPEAAGFMTNSATQIWLYSSLMSNGSHYIDKSTSPMSVYQMQLSNVYSSAKTKQGFGLSVYTFDMEHSPGKFTSCRVEDNPVTIWSKQIPISSYIEYQSSALSVASEVSSILLPQFYAKLKPGVTPVPHKDVLLWDVVCKQYQYFRKTDIPIVLDDYMKAHNSWYGTTFQSMPCALVNVYFEVNEETVQPDHLYLAYDCSAMKPDKVDKLYSKEEFNNMRTFFGGTYRRYIEVPYIANDPIRPIDYGRQMAKVVTLESIAREPELNDYISEL